MGWRDELLKLMARGLLVPGDGARGAAAMVRAIERIAADDALSERLDVATSEEVRAVFLQLYAEELAESDSD